MREVRAPNAQASGLAPAAENAGGGEVVNSQIAAALPVGGSEAVASAEELAVPSAEAAGDVISNHTAEPGVSESQVVARSQLEREADAGAGGESAPDWAELLGPVPRVQGDRSPSDAGDFIKVFQEYERYVASIGSRILGPGNGVEDLVQEVFLVIYQEFHKLQGLSSIKAWLATIATRLAWRQRGRSWLHSKMSLTQLEELNPLEAPDASPELQADLSALLDRLRSMPSTLREPWLLRFIDGETLPRIAELCECSQSTVQRRLKEAGEVMLGEKPTNPPG